MCTKEEDLHQPLLGVADVDELFWETFHSDTSPVKDSAYSNDIGPDFLIEYIEYPTVVDKCQRRVKQVDSGIVDSQQRLLKDQAKVCLRLNFQNGGQASFIEVFVVRTPEAYSKIKDVLTEPVPLGYFVVHDYGYIFEFKLDLDSVYKHNGRRVYELAKNQTDEVNKFQLMIKVTYLDNTVITQYTKTFLVRGKSVKNGQDAQSPCEKAPKRPRTATDDSVGSEETFGSSGISDMFLSSNEMSPSASAEMTFAEYKTLIANRIVAKIAEIDELTIASPIKCPDVGDIAYHFILKDPYSHPSFEEGDCIGFFTDKLGKTVIDKLTPANYEDSFLIGVITRSHYLEAMKPKTDDVRTETVCMLGIVPVKVQGTVYRGDLLYASLSAPGVAMSAYNMTTSPKPTGHQTAIGYAGQTKKCDKEEEINLVPSFVSLIIGFEEKLVNRKILEVEESFSSKVDFLQWKGLKEKRCRRICYASVFLVFVLLCILFWQVFIPGTAFKYWYCRKGSIHGSKASFSFVPLSNKFIRPTTNGVEFSWKKLKKKMNLDFEPLNISGVRYFLNIDRCAYGSIRSTEDKVLGLKVVYGPNIFAINANCSTVYYHDENLNKWTPYSSAKPNNIHCSF